MAAGPAVPGERLCCCPCWQLLYSLCDIECLCVQGALSWQQGLLFPGNANRMMCMSMDGRAEVCKGEVRPVLCALCMLRTLQHRACQQGGGW